MQRRAWIATGSVALGLGVLALAGGGLTGWAGGDPLGCTIDAGAKENGVVPIHAECSWPDRSPERVEQVLAELEHHADVFGSLGASPVLERADGYALQRQVHVAPGIADREIMVEWQVDPPGEDGRRYAWSIAGDQSQRDASKVAPLVHEGAWEVHEAGAGVRVTYNMRYSPGGNVPYFLVRWFQGSGVRDVLQSLHHATG